MPVYRKTLEELIMREKTNHEIDAISDAIAAAGAYVESMGTTDLAKMTSAQFRELVTVSALSFCASVSQRATKDDEVPF